MFKVNDIIRCDKNAPYGVIWEGYKNKLFKVTGVSKNNIRLELLPGELKEYPEYANTLVAIRVDDNCYYLFQKICSKVGDLCQI